MQGRIKEHWKGDLWITDYDILYSIKYM
jgi:hypothetical protein